jgi:hypothetical protein
MCNSQVLDSTNLKYLSFTIWRTTWFGSIFIPIVDFGLPGLLCFNVTFNNILFISWLSVLLVEETWRKAPTCRNTNLKYLSFTIWRTTWFGSINVMYIKHVNVNNWNELDLLLHMQSVSITIDAVSLNLDQGKTYNIMW